MKWLLAKLLRRFARALGVTELQIRVDEFAKDIHRLRTEERALTDYAERRLEHVREYVEVLVADHSKRNQELADAIQAAMMGEMIRHTESVSRSTSKELEQIESTLRREMDRLRSSISLPVQRDAGRELDTGTSAIEIEESMYIALEDHFRGDPRIIRDRQSSYVNLVQDSVDADFPLLDIGFGRGEWLELLRDSGIPARGIDTNTVSVKEATTKGLDVCVADVSEYLAGLEDGSLGAVTLFQVLEHLPFDALVNSLRSILRVLRPGGVLIAEVPNSENLSVGSSTFWIDPTHQRPLFPELLRFLAREVGYKAVDGIYSSPLKDEPSLETVNEPLKSIVHDIHRRIYGPGDFALIARG